MAEIELEDVDKRLVNLVQAEFPLTPAPYDDLGSRLGVSGAEVLRRIAQLRETRVIRLIGPVLDARKLGYQATLVAVRATGERQAAAEQAIAAHPGVSHGYERDNYFNIWFTFAALAERIDDELRRLLESVPSEACVNLPALKLFKIGAYFDMYEYGQEAPSGVVSSGGTLPGRVELSPEDRVVINQLPQDLPLVPAPFIGIAERSGMDVAGFLSRCRSLRERGVMRRFGASVNHRKAGYTANAMTCWAVPPGLADTFGHRLASLKEVSHCYERRTGGLWRYNIFAMIHHRSKAGCEEIADRVSAENGLADRVMLFSTREFKKTRVRYRV